MTRSSELPALEADKEQVRCCGVSRTWDLAKRTGPVLSLSAVIAVAVMSYLAGQNSATPQYEVPAIDSLPLINATAAVTSEKFSMATGTVSDESEGLFVLDHNSGLLQCSVIYPRSGQFLGRFTTNVAETLGTGAKGGQYIMVTGQANFPRASNRPAAPTVLYVMDSASGNYACYGVPFDQTAVPRNQPQQGLLVLIGVGSANPLVDRDDLR